MGIDANEPQVLNWDDVPKPIRDQIDYAQAHPELTVPRGPRRQPKEQ
jgi:hypothetical protein